MNDESQILRSDLTILEEMVIEVEPYLMSDTIRWPLAKQDRPELSLGGCLMRQLRLQALITGHCPPITVHCPLSSA